jgi:putative ATPase
MVECPICTKPVKSANINQHIDSGCQTLIEDQPSGSDQPGGPPSVSSFFHRPATNQAAAKGAPNVKAPTSFAPSRTTPKKPTDESAVRNKRPVEPTIPSDVSDVHPGDAGSEDIALKRLKTSNPFQNELPLAARMRPRNLDDIYGQELVGPKGLLRELIQQGRIPSMVLWGDPGTGKTTIARVIASTLNCRSIEINSSNFAVGECKKIFFEVWIDVLAGGFSWTNTHRLAGTE